MSNQLPRDFYCHRKFNIFLKVLHLVQRRGNPGKLWYCVMVSGKTPVHRKLSWLHTSWSFADKSEICYRFNFMRNEFNLFFLLFRVVFYFWYFAGINENSGITRDKVKMQKLQSYCFSTRVLGMATMGWKLLFLKSDPKYPPNTIKCIDICLKT